MPDATVILVLIVVVGLVVVISRSSRGPDRPSRPPEAAVTSSLAHIPSTSYSPSSLTGDEDFYRDEDEFAVFADEGDE